MRLSALLHQRIFEDVLSPLSPSLPLAKEANTVLDDIADASSGFLVFSDNFISTMYPPQVAEHISIELESYQRQLALLQTKLEPLMSEDSVEMQLHRLQLSATDKSSDHYRKLQKWYITCINQISKNIHELEHELKGPETPLA